MPGHDCLLGLLASLSLSGPSGHVILAYVGPGPGVEFIPYFLGLLAWAGLALGALLLWPLAALGRRLLIARRRRQLDPGEAHDRTTTAYP